MDNTSRDKLSCETQLILKILDEHKESNDAQVRAIQTHMNAGFDTLASEMREIKQAKQIQNGRVEKLEKITWVNRFIYNNPKFSGLVLIISYLGISEIIKKVNFVELIKKLF